jgi:hypothetical protein
MLAWAKVHMEHARGTIQASWFSKNPKHIKGTDVSEVAVDKLAAVIIAKAAPLLWSLQAEIARCAASGVWESAGTISGTVYACTTGKWKGKGGKGGKGQYNVGTFVGCFGGDGGGRGENGGDGKYGKGGYSDDYGKSKGAGKYNRQFDRHCNHCGAYGRSMPQARPGDRRKLDQEIAANGKGKGKAGPAM